MDKLQLKYVQDYANSLNTFVLRRCFEIPDAFLYYLNQYPVHLFCLSKEADRLGFLGISRYQRAFFFKELKNLMPN